MSLNLSKGSTLNLSKDFGLRKLSLELKWSKGYDLDSYVYTVDKQGVKNFIYFGNKEANGVFHHGDDLHGGGSKDKPNEIIDINLDKQHDISDIYVGVFVYSSGVAFEDISFCEVSLRDKDTNKIIATCGSNKKLKGKSLLLSHIRNCNGEFKVKCISECSELTYHDVMGLKGCNIHKYTDIITYLLGYRDTQRHEENIYTQRHENTNNIGHESTDNKTGCVNRIKNFFKNL